MSDWMDEYGTEEDFNEKYRLLWDELARLRAAAHAADERPVPEIGTIRPTVERLNERTDGQLVVFVANDFGRIGAFRPREANVEVQDRVRRAILSRKYDEHPDLDEIRRELLRSFPAIHKAMVAEYDEGDVRYHLPEGSNEATNFLTVREMVGLVDYVTNSTQSDDMSLVY